MHRPLWCYLPSAVKAGRISGLLRHDWSCPFTKPVLCRAEALLHPKSRADAARTSTPLGFARGFGKSWTGPCLHTGCRVALGWTGQRPVPTHALAFAVVEGVNALGPLGHHAFHGGFGGGGVPIRCGGSGRSVNSFFVRGDSRSFASLRMTVL